jgi:hypothetical protein
MSGDTIVLLDEDRFGLLSGPRMGEERSVCLLLFNAGFIHRSGPFRLHVRLARQLADAEVASFRFDAPGLGDALARSDKPLLETVRTAMDILQARHGYSRFVVGGLCSAADLGWQVALDDARVVGVLSIDGLARMGWWYRLAKLRRVLGKPPSVWVQRLLRRVRAPAPALASIAADDLRDWPQPGSEPAQMAALVARGVQMFFLYTGGAGYFLHPGQFAETWGRSSRAPTVEVEHWPQCDHTFFAESDRRRLIERIADWMRRRFAQ